MGKAAFPWWAEFKSRAFDVSTVRKDELKLSIQIVNYNG